MTSRQPTAEALAAAREWLEHNCREDGENTISGAGGWNTSNEFASYGDEAISSLALLLDRWALRAKAEAAEECGKRVAVHPAHRALAEVCHAVALRYRAQLDELKGGSE